MTTARHVCKLSTKPLTMSRALNHRWKTAIAAIVALGLCRALSCGAAEEFTLETARAAAEKGDAQAEYFLAKHYAKGDGVPQNFAKAAEYMQQAAQQGVAFAQNDLGAFYAKGLGVKRDFAEAAKWYRKAAEQGDALAQFSMGRIYSLGRGVPQDMQEAIRWFKKAAEQNQPDALETLGDIYLNGRNGITMDYAEARKYFQDAVKQGRVDALNSLGFMYEYGHGTPVNPERAVECYREAAEKNDARGQMNLGRLYEEGSGVKKDMTEAYKWFFLAERNGEGIARHYLEELEDTFHIPLTEIDEARKRAQAFINSQEAKAEKKSTASSTASR